MSLNNFKYYYLTAASRCHLVMYQNNKNFEFEETEITILLGLLAVKRDFYIFTVERELYEAI